jgi:hypothetical protein
VNRTRPLLPDCGIHTKLAVKALQSADTLSDPENMNPQKVPPGVRRNLSGSVCEAEYAWRL